MSNTFNKKWKFKEKNRNKKVQNGILAEPPGAKQAKLGLTFLNTKKLKLTSSLDLSFPASDTSE